MKLSNKSTLLILGILLIVFVMFFRQQVKASKDDVTYYKTANIKLNGKITAFEALKYGHNFGVISIKLDKTNTKEYDEREQRKRFLGVIKNGQADLVFNSINNVKIGDSIVVNTKDYRLYRNQKLITKNKLTMPLPELILTPFDEINNIIKL